MSYTDYIETNSEFTINLSQRMNIYYSYLVDKRLVIRQTLSADDNLNPIVFQQVIDVTETPEVLTGYIAKESLVLRLATEAEPAAYQFHFRAENDNLPGSTHLIHPIDHIITYFNFTDEQSQQMAYQARRTGEENILANGLRGFSAELLITFKYDLRDSEYIADSLFNQTLTYGYRIPLTTEVYSFTTTGTPDFEWQHIEVAEDVEITLFMVIIFTVLFILSLFGLLYSAKKLREDSNVHRRESENILNKYTDEIVVYDRPMNLTRYESRLVQDFAELLKLAINLNKHIMCYKDESYAEFAVIVDEFACLYVIIFNDIEADMYIEDEEVEENTEKELLAIKWDNEEW